MSELTVSTIGGIPATANVKSVPPPPYLDVNQAMQSILLWTPAQQAYATQPGGERGGSAFVSQFFHDQNAISLTFLLRRLQPVANAQVSPLSTGVISQSQNVTPFQATSFIFPLNPLSLDTTKQKVRQWNLTNGGFILNSWGNDTVKMSLAGRSSTLVPEWDFAPGTLVPPSYGIYQTQAYANFKLLEFYNDYFNGGNEDNRLLRMLAPARVTLTLGNWGGQFDGIISQFKFKLDGDKPFSIEFSFDFEAVPRLQYPSTILSPG